MAHAHCLNDDCGHDWKLQKAPGEYANGVKCPTCGSSNVDIEFDGDGGRQEPRRERRAPAREEEARRERAPASPGSLQFGEPESAGDAVAQAAVTAVSDEVSTQQKAQAVKGGLNLVADAAARFMSYQGEIKKRQEEAAKDADLVRAEDKPRCDECGHVFSEIPMSQDRIKCPGCGVEYIIG